MSDDLKRILNAFATNNLDSSQLRFKRALLDTGMAAASKQGSFGVLQRSLLAGLIASAVLVVDGKMTQEQFDRPTRDVLALASYIVARALAKKGKRVCRSVGPITEPSSAMGPPPPVAKSGKAPAKAVTTKSAISKQQHLPPKKRR